ncbi:hypothetical protein HDU76_008017 [Blyttiomyces sp. JEL0837]|nr:hypothetical protein HDU76_008017 [Blyttiomyces sp. JEL0837]
MLNRDPTQRLGANGADEIKRHPFFSDINWQKLMARKYNPPFRPDVSSATDTSNFDEEFTSEKPTDSYVADSKLTEADQRQFEGFSYRADALAGSVQAGSLMGANSRLNNTTTGNGSYVGSFVGSLRGAGGDRRR